jgi:hypothetical protein
MESKLRSKLIEHGVGLTDDKTDDLVKELLVLFSVSSCTCNIPEPIMKNSENGISAYCKKCTKQYYR